MTTQDRSNAGRLIVGIIDTLRDGRRRNCAEITRAVFDLEGLPVDDSFSSLYAAVWQRLERMERDGCVRRHKGRPMVMWELVETVE